MDLLFKHVSKFTERISDSLVLFVVIVSGGVILMANVTAAGVPTVSNLGPTEFVDGSTTVDTTPTLTFDVDYSAGHGNQIYYEVQIFGATGHGAAAVDYISDATADGSFSYTVGQSGGTYVTGSSSMQLTDDDYTWQVKAFDAVSAILSSGYVQANGGSTAFVVETGLAISHVQNSDPLLGQPITITWETNLQSSSIVDYGPDSSYGTQTDESDTPHGVTSHSVELPVLPVGTYHYSVTSNGADHSLASSSDATFTIPNTDPTVTKFTPEEFISGWTIANASDYSFGFALDDADADRVQYRILIDDDSDFSSPAVDYIDPISATGTAGQKTFTVGQPEGDGSYSIGEEDQVLADGSYYWGVRAFDQNGGDSGSYEGPTIDGPMFIVDHTYVNANPVVTFRDVNVDGAKIRESSPTLSMMLTDANTDDLVSFTIIIDDSSDFSSPVVSYSEPMTVESTLSQGRHDFIVGQSDFGIGFYSVGEASQTLADGTYYVEAQVSDNRGGSSPLTPANGGASAFTIDTVLPEISAIATSGVTGSAVTVTWTTDEASSTEIEYGTTDSYGDSSVDGTLTTNHSVTITGLSEATLYHYRVTSTDEAGNASTSLDDDVTTLDVTAPTISSVSSGSLTGTGATITWTTDEASDSQVQYGTTTSYGASTTLDATMLTSHSVDLTGLLENRTYHYRVKSRDAAGNLRTGSDNTFITLDQTAPEISNIVATPSGSSVTITWDTDEAGSSRVEYGTTTSYGFLTSQIDTSPRVTSHSVTISGFGTSGTRHFRVLSTDDSSNTGTSSDGTFTIDLNVTPDVPTSLGGDAVTGGGSMSDTTPSFTFTLDDNDALDEVKYQIEIDDSEDFSSPVVDYTSALGNQSSKTFTVGQAVGGGSYGAGEESQTLADGSYYWRVRAIDEHAAASAYVEANGGAVAFILSTTPTEGPTISDVSVSTTSTSATFTWTTDRNAYPQIDYGITSDYELSIDLLSLLRNGQTSHEITLTDLVACTKYHYRPIATDDYNNVTHGDDGVFATTGCPGDATISVEHSRQVTALAGGRVTLSDDGKQVDLDVPVSFANGTNAVFQVKKLSRTEVLTTISLPTGYEAVGDHTYDFKAFQDPQNLISSFDNSLTIIMQYTSDDIIGLDETTLTIYRFDGSTRTQLSDCIVDTENKTVTCSTDGFSTFVLSGQSSGGTTTGGSSTSGSTTSGSTTGGTTGGTTTGGSTGEDSVGALILYPPAKNAKPTTVGGVIKGKPSRIVFGRNLKTGSTGVDVKALQMYLNQHGYTISKTGLGASGNETSSFGAKTKAALIKFQQAAMKAKIKLRLTEKLGEFGASTRTYINTIQK